MEIGDRYLPHSVLKCLLDWRLYRFLGGFACYFVMGGRGGMSCFGDFAH